ncbi:MAG: hypothetical protein WDW36_004877 [Sanguina aurantia]
MAASPATTSSVGWQRYYDSGTLPWDTAAPSSQLQQYMRSCVYEGEDGSIIFEPVELTAMEPPASHTSSYHICPRCSHMKPPSDGYTLELACGTGSSSVYMGDLGLNSVGVDVMAGAVTTARRIASDRGLTSGSCTFVQHDVFALPQPFTRQLALQLLETQQENNSSPGETASSPPSHQQQEKLAAGTKTTAPTNGKAFQFAYDCQAFHALRAVDEKRYVSLLYSSLAPQAHLMLLVGNSDEPPVGPPVLSKEQIRSAFPPSQWKEIFILPSRFDRTPSYDKLSKNPLAWWVLLQRL